MHVTITYKGSGSLLYRSNFLYCDDDGKEFELIRCPKTWNHQSRPLFLFLAM